MDQEHPENRDLYEYIEFRIELKDVDKLQAFFDFITIDFLSVPTPGSTTETNTVLVGQKETTWYNR